MAKKRGGRKPVADSKSGAIREMLESHGMSTASKDIIAALAGRGIEVSSAHVANVRGRMLQKAHRGPAPAVAATTNGRRRKRRGRKPGPKPGRKPGRPAASSMENTLLQVKRVADIVGLEEARRALDLLAKLQG